MSNSQISSIQGFILSTFNIRRPCDFHHFKISLSQIITEFLVSMAFDYLDPMLSAELQIVIDEYIEPKVFLMPTEFKSYNFTRYWDMFWVNVGHSDKCAFLATSNFMKPFFELNTPMISKAYFHNYSSPLTFSNGACHPGGHYWDYYIGTHSFSQVTTTYLKTRGPSQ